MGARFASVERRAKYIVMRLEPEGALVGHLRMTGRMHVEDGTGHPGQVREVRLDLDDGRAFHFIDVRKFGRLEFVRDPERALAELGPEPLGEHFTFEWLRDALRGHRRRLKPLLLDQTFLAGLGNIYVDESLHRARLHPLQLAARVSAPAARALHREIRSVLVCRRSSAKARASTASTARPKETPAAIRTNSRCMAGPDCRAAPARPQFVGWSSASAARTFVRAVSRRLAARANPDLGASRPRDVAWCGASARAARDSTDPLAPDGLDLG